MCEEKCLCPCLYTRSKSECFSSRAARGKATPAFAAGSFTLRSGASALTSSQSCTKLRPLLPVGGRLIAETRRYGNTLAPFGPAARQHRGSALGFHASPEPVLLRALALV